MLDQLAAVVESPLALGPTLLLAATGVGLVLWLAGRRLARMCCAGCGLVLGGAVAWAACREVGAASQSLIWVALGSVAGFLFALLMFKVWMGVSCGVLLALTIPAVSLVWEGVDPPPTQELFPQAAQQNDLQDPDALIAYLAGMYDRQREVLSSWGGDLDPGRLRTLVFAAAAGALIGLMAGLAFPYPVAAFESALVGAGLMMLGVLGIFASQMPGASGWVADQPRVLIVVLGLITLMGVGIQWTISKPKTDM